MSSPTGASRKYQQYVFTPFIRYHRTEFDLLSDQGILRVNLFSGHDIRAADRGGKSDPFAVFSLNGQKVWKSQTKKKTLNPEWYEDFTVSVVCSLFGFHCIMHTQSGS